MSRRLHLAARSMTVAFVASVLVPWASAQDTARKPPRRLPPTGSQTSAIPAGVDTGSPATSDSMPLGMPVPPTGAVDRNDQSTAAARAAARPRSAAPAASGPAAASNGSRPVAAASAVKPARSQKQ